MKHKRHIKITQLFSLLALLLLSSFSMDVGYYDSTNQVPVLMARSEFEQAIKTLPPKPLSQTTRIYLMPEEHKLFVVELYRGVHVIDNSDPKDPKVLYFINIPGCMDMSIKDEVLYARSAEDLVAIDISNLSDVVEIQRVRETFPELYNMEGYYFPSRFSKENRPDNTVIVAWEENN